MAPRLPLHPYREGHTPVLLERLQQLGLAAAAEAVEAVEWASVLLVIEGSTAPLVAVVSLEA